MVIGNRGIPHAPPNDQMTIPHSAATGTERKKDVSKRKRASIETTKTNLGHIGTSVDPDILTYAMAQAGAMGQSSQQAALEAARLQQLRDSGKRVIFDDNDVGYHAA
jgi:hypothetical protein